MKEQLETIPVNDAINGGTECTLCFLLNKENNRLRNYFTGNSVMQNDIRKRTNKTGFCPEHFTGLLEVEGTHQGLALMAHTHFKKAMRRVRETTSKLKEECKKKPGNNPLSKSKKTRNLLKAYSGLVMEYESECLICTRLDEAQNRYMFTICHLYKMEDEFRSRFAQLCSICQHHLPALLDYGFSFMPEKVFNPFALAALNLFEKEFFDLERSLGSFTQKFKHDNTGKSSGNSKQPLPSMIKKIVGNK